MAGTPASSRGSAAQTFVRVGLRHSADFTDVAGGAPVVTATDNTVSSALALPPSAFGNDSQINVIVYNDSAASVKIGGSLVVQNAAGTVWLERDTSADQTIAAGASARIDFAGAGGGAGAGLAWNATSKQIDIALAGVFSAFVTLYAIPG